MKSKSSLIIVFCLILLAFMSCDKDYLKPNGIAGVWIWVKSEGGFADITLTPATEGISRHLIIDDSYFTVFEDDSIVFQSKYELITKPDAYFETDRYIKFDFGGEEPYIVNKKVLQLFDQCDDCFFHTYIRK
jgi:hypothetical protein